MRAFASAGRAIALALVAVLAAAGAAARAPTIVSINLCADQMALALADRAQILSLGRLAADPALSALHAQAKGIPTNGAAAEEIELSGAVHHKGARNRDRQGKHFGIHARISIRRVLRCAVRRVGRAARLEIRLLKRAEAKHSRVAVLCRRGQHMHRAQQVVTQDR